MSEDNTTTKKASKKAMTRPLGDDERDALWISCYTAALTGVLAAATQAGGENPQRIGQVCCDLADAALKAIERRHESGPF